MNLVAGFFYLFSGLTVASAFMVIATRNPVHAVLFLILAFFNSAGLFLLLGAEFIAMVLVIIYVGAVAILFLFVVMMLDVDFAELKAGFTQYLPLGALIGIILLIELVLVLGAWLGGDVKIVSSPMAPIPLEGSGVTNTESIGNILYTDYVFYFELAGLILLIAMIGAIVLTLHQKKDVKRQDIAKQVARTREGSIEMVDVESGTAVFSQNAKEEGS